MARRGSAGTTSRANGRFEVPAPASGQTCVLLVTGKDGSVVRREGARIEPCRTASVDVRI